MHGCVGNAICGCADGFAIEDEDDFVGRPLDAGGMPRGEGGAGIVAILVVIRGRILVMHEGTDIAGKVALGEVDLSIMRPGTTIGPEQPGCFKAG